MGVSIPSLIINFVIAALCGFVGFCMIQDAVLVRPIKEKIEGVLKTLISKDLFVHHAIIGGIILLIGVAAAFNFVMILAKGYGFWM